MVEIIRALGRVQAELANLQNEIIEYMTEEEEHEVDLDFHLPNLVKPQKVITCFRCGRVLGIDSDFEDDIELARRRVGKPIEYRTYCADCVALLN